jgi:hypothetical protein
MLNVIYGFIGGGIVGFVAGALVYRNNAPKADKVVTTAQAVGADAQKVAADAQALTK